MLRSVRTRSTIALAAVATALVACADGAPVEPRAARPALDRGVELGSCGNLAIEAGHRLAFRAYAVGVQRYRWTGSAWTFAGPQATLYANENASGVVGTHFGGPTWQSVSGSMVKATLVDQCKPDANAIPWFELAAVADSGPGIFEGVTFIQRINTTGGLVPSTPGTVVDEVVGVPYTAVYTFWKKED